MKWLSLIILLFPLITYGQDVVQKNWSLNGYVTNMQSFMFQEWDGEWLSDNLIHNRLNFKINNTANTLNAAIELRNRFLSGESVKTVPDYPAMINEDKGFVKLSDNLFKGKSYIFNSKVDRAYLDYTKDKFQVRVGRQRINWGQCFTWNPNDLFNNFSFFDFDYIEKPGSDAIRLQYYGNNTSSLEFAIKANNNRKITSATLYRFNKWNYDFQLLMGVLNEEDLVLGNGWSGNLAGASFRGEISYFHPRKNFADTSGVVVMSLGSEYSFENSLVLQVEFLYNQGNMDGSNNFTDFYNMSLSAKRLSFTDLSFMLQASYPVTPLFNISVSSLYFPNLKGFFAGPSLTYSLTENIDFSFISQSFSWQLDKSQREYFHLGFLRLKWNF